MSQLSPVQWGQRQGGQQCGDPTSIPGHSEDARGHPPLDGELQHAGPGHHRHQAQQQEERVRRWTQMRDFNFVIPSCIAIAAARATNSWDMEGMIPLNPLFINTMIIVQINAKQFFKYKDCVFESLSIMMDSCPN